MRRDREFWRRHVKAWRASGVSQREYCRREGLQKGSLSYWSSTLGRETGKESDLVEVGRTSLKADSPRSSVESGRPIEVVVEGRYLMRLWPGTSAEHMRSVLSVLERRR